MVLTMAPAIFRNWYQSRPREFRPKRSSQRTTRVSLAQGIEQPFALRTVTKAVLTPESRDRPLPRSKRYPQLPPGCADAPGSGLLEPVTRQYRTIFIGCLSPGPVWIFRLSPGRIRALRTVISGRFGSRSMRVEIDGLSNRGAAQRSGKAGSTDQCERLPVLVPQPRQQHSPNPRSICRTKRFIGVNDCHTTGVHCTPVRSCAVQ